MIYLLHFNRRYKHAGHYLGFADGLEALKERLNKHRNGNGANLLAVIRSEGITWQLARIWRGKFADRTEERRIKKKGGLSRVCPICADNYKRGMNNTIVKERRNGTG